MNSYTRIYSQKHQCAFMSVCVLDTLCGTVSLLAIHFVVGNTKLYEPPTAHTTTPPTIAATSLGYSFNAATLHLPLLLAYSVWCCCCCCWCSQDFDFLWLSTLSGFHTFVDVRCLALSCECRSFVTLLRALSAFAQLVWVRLQVLLLEWTLAPNFRPCMLRIRICCYVCGMATSIGMSMHS